MTSNTSALISMVENVNILFIHKLLCLFIIATSEQYTKLRKLLFLFLEMKNQNSATKIDNTSFHFIKPLVSCNFKRRKIEVITKDLDRLVKHNC